jgi:hypothetical protein
VGIVGDDGAVNGKHLSEQVKDVLFSSASFLPFRGEWVHLGNGLIVDSNQILLLRIDLQSAVEAEGGLNGSIGLSRVSAQLFSAGDLGHEVGLLLLDIGREALSLGVTHGLAQTLALRLFRRVQLCPLRFRVLLLLLLQ